MLTGASEKGDLPQFIFGQYPLLVHTIFRFHMRVLLVHLSSRPFHSQRCALPYMMIALARLPRVSRTFMTYTPPRWYRKLKLHRN
jgi:hypothetical protein